MAEGRELCNAAISMKHSHTHQLKGSATRQSVQSGVGMLFARVHAASSLHATSNSQDGSMKGAIASQSLHQ